MKLSVLTLLILSAFYGHAQIESPFNHGANLLGLGNSGVALEGSSAVFYNQAGIAQMENWSAGIHGARLYNDSGLLHLHAGLILPSKKLGVLGLTTGSFGLEDYNFQKYSVTYAKKLFANFNLAASFNLYQFRIENYGNAFTPNLEIGFLTRLTDQISLGAHVANPFPIQVSDRTVIPTIFSAGLRYEVSTLVSIFADVEKNIRERENFKVGVDYQIHERFSLRAGINTNPGTFYFGFIARVNQLEISLGNGYHQVLGNTTGLGVIYTNQKK